MRTARLDWDGRDARRAAAEIRAMQPDPADVAAPVTEMIAAVSEGGDRAALAAAERFGEAPARGLRVRAERIEQAATRADTSALEAAKANVEQVAAAETMADLRVTLPQQQSVRLRSVAVESAGVYVPGGGASYPSSLVMGCVPARVAGVERVVVATPPGEDGEVDELVLAAAAICDVEEVYALGGAQAIAALALGTETIEPVDVIVGPGNRYVQEAKRQLAGRVGIDGIAGPSELMVVCDRTAPREWLALDLCAQAEHGADGLLVAAATETALLDELEAEVARVASEHGHVGDAPFALVEAPSAEAALELANALAPEHLQLACEGADELSLRAATPGCVFIGALGATAFGDYAAGSNHVLPTGGAGRFTGPLGPIAFRRRIATVRIPEEAARELAPTVARLARSEGFPLHAESVEIREGKRR